MGPPRLERRRVSKIYANDGQNVEALRDVSFEIAAGSITALVGRSGCGKSTLLNLAGAMDFPTSGDVLIDGRSTTALSEQELTNLRRKRIGFVFQFFQLLPTLTVLENVELPLLLAGEADTAGPARDRLRWVGLEDKAQSYPHQLSGGEMQRVAIARALAHSPDILIADEPTGNLDTASGDQALTLRRDLIRTALTIVSVALGVAVVIAIELAGEAAAGSFRSSLETLLGKTDLQITANGGVDETWVARLAVLPRNLRVAPVIETQALIDGAGSVPVYGIDALAQGTAEAAAKSGVAISGAL